MSCTGSHRHFKTHTILHQDFRNTSSLILKLCGTYGYLFINLIIYTYFTLKKQGTAKRMGTVYHRTVT